MRVKIIKDVPGYRTGTSYSVSDDLACHLVADCVAEGETRESHAAILRAIEKRLSDLRGESVTERFVDMAGFVNESGGPESKSQKRKTKKTRKNKT